MKFFFSAIIVYVQNLFPFFICCHIELCIGLTLNISTVKKVFSEKVDNFISISNLRKLNFNETHIIFILIKKDKFKYFFLTNYE